MKRRTRLFGAVLVALVLAGGALAAVRSTLGQDRRIVSAGGVGAANVGQGPVATVLRARPYQVELSLTPNRATKAGIIALTLLKGGRPVSGARVRLTLSMLEMDMGQVTGLLPQTGPGRYAHAGPVLGMGGRWKLRFEVTPPRGRSFGVAVVDRMGQ